jgi:hypothetical protein
MKCSHSIASYTTGHPYAMIANLVREYRPPETPTEYIYIFRAYRDGRLSDILGWRRGGRVGARRRPHGQP